MDHEKENEFVERTEPVKENIRWIKTAWISERVGYLLLAAFIVFSTLGGLSQGILSDRLYQNEKGDVRVKYEKILRNSSESDIFITYPTIGNKPQIITLEGDYIQDYDIEYINPHNIRASTTAHGLVLYPPVTTKAESATAKITFKPNESGRYHMRIALDGKGILTINQYVLP